MIQGLESHSRRHRAITDDGDRTPILAQTRCRHRHAERGTDRCARVPHAKSVVLALATRREGRKPAILLDRMQTFAPAREYLVRVGLMADVPHEAVARGVVDVMQRDGELHRTQTRGEVTATGADAVDQEVTQLRGHGRQLRGRQVTQIRGAADFRQQRGVVHGDRHSASVYTWAAPAPKCRRTPRSGGHSLSVPAGSPSAWDGSNRGDRRRVVAMLQQDFDLLLCRFQAGLADMPGQCHATLEVLQGFIERQVTALQPLHQPLQLGEGLLEIQGLAGARHAFVA